MDAGVLALLRTLAIAAIAAGALYFLRAEIRAPVQTKLDAALGNNAALKAGAEAQNAGVDALKVASDKRKALSEVAVSGAGKPEFAAAKRIQETKAPGDTPLARAANRITAEFSR